MAQQGAENDPKPDRDLPAVKRMADPDPLDSGIRRKFLVFCQENPWADECRIYDS